MNELKRLMDADAFLGRGWSFPRTDGRRREDVLLRKGHRGEPTYPVQYLARRAREPLRLRLPLRRYAFEPMTTETMVRMRNDITRAVILFEPRVMLEDVSFEEQSVEGLLLIRLTYTVVRTNNRNNMVYPFYLNEGNKDN